MCCQEKLLFVLSFENEEDRKSFSKYYVPIVEIKDFNVLSDGKSFFDVPVKNKKHTKKWALVKIMITQLVIYWTTSIFQNIKN